MTPADQHASMVLSLIGLGALAIGSFAMFLRWASRQLTSRGVTGRDVIGNIADDVKRGEGFRHPLRTRTQRTNARSAVQERSARQGARSGVQDRSSVQPVPGEILPNSREELQQLVAAIGHKRDGKTKQEAIERAFNIKKGGSPAWKRASDLFDAATIPPSRYQELDEDARPAVLSKN